MRRKNLFRLQMLIAVLIAGLFSHAVWADTTEYADLDRTNRLVLHLESVVEEVKKEEGAKVKIYKIAGMKYQGSDLQYVYTDDWKELTADLSKEVSEEEILKMRDLAEKKQLTGIEKTSDKDGNVYYPDLPQGVYLVVQTDEVTHFSTFEPFLVYLPCIEENHWKYDVVAEPKIVYQVRSGSRDPSEPDPTLPESPSEPQNPPREEPPKEDTPPKLPQTGQLNWPIPVLLVAGAFLVSAGVIVRLAGRKEDEKEL